MQIELRQLAQKDREIDLKAQKQQADNAIAADKEELARDKHNDNKMMQLAELSAQGIRMGHEAAQTAAAVQPPVPPPAPQLPIPGAEST